MNKKLPTSYTLAGRNLFLEPKLADQRAVCALVGLLKVAQVLAAVGNEPQKAAARVFVLAIFIEVSRKLFDPARQNSNLHLRRPGVGVVALSFADLICLLALGEHRQRVSHSQTNARYRPR